MKQKLLIFFFLILLVVVLVGLNAANYVQRDKMPDTEMLPNRSTYNSGSTGTKAFYTLLVETGRKVTRWQEPPSALLKSKSPPAVFVVIGRVRRDFTDDEIESLLRWTSNGGRLVVIDREPPTGLVTTTANWRLELVQKIDGSTLMVDPSDKQQMIGKTIAAKPVQPTIYTKNVIAVQPSKFAASVRFSRLKDKLEEKYDVGTDGDKGIPTYRETYEGSSTDDGETLPSELAPIVHFGNSDENLVVETQFGNGRIILVADPYIVSNSGIELVDNAQFGLNLVSAGQGLIAFDEYHQGYGNNRDGLVQFFAGTPIIPIFLQATLLIGLIFYSQSRRFARAVPEPEAKRLAKLEYVTAMAELQNRMQAFDLAIENIYLEFRRRAANLFGLDVRDATSEKLAPRIAERTGLDSTTIYTTLFTCEEIIRGEPTNKRDVLRLTGHLRAIEEKLGIARVRRSVAR